MGSERIASKLNPELVEAVEALDRLEQEGSEEGPQKKRHQIDDDHDHESESKRTRANSPAPLPSLPSPAEPSLDQVLPPPPQNGLLSSEAIQGLRSLAASNLALKLQPLSSAQKSPLVGLADYGSDDDSTT
jgi:hypothetical protein